MRITVPESARRLELAPQPSYEASPGAAARRAALRTAPFAALRTAPFAALRTAARFAVVLVAWSFLSSLTGCLPQKGTIGAVIAQEEDSGRLFLREVPPGLAAARADLKVGDEILLIDGLDVRFMDAKQINAALLGEVDSAVKLTLIRDEQVLRVTLKRTEAQKLLKAPRNSVKADS